MLETKGIPAVQGQRTSQEPFTFVHAPLTMVDEGNFVEEDIILPFGKQLLEK